MAPHRRAAIRAMRAVAILATVVVGGACAAVTFAPVIASVVGTLACAVLAGAALYAAFEGFDDALRRGTWR